MSDNIQTPEVEAEESQKDIDIEAILAENERLKKHAQTLLAEKKAKDEQARQYEAEKIKAEQEAAMKAGDFEKLKASMAAEVERERNEKLSLIEKINQDKLEREARNIASELTDNATNQKLLQRFIQDRLSINDGAVHYADESGQASQDRDRLVNEFRTCGLYDSLLFGSRASGTGGTGSSTPVTKNPDELTEAERIKLYSEDRETFKKLFN